MLSAKQIAPGESGQIEVTVKAETDGPLNKSVTVQSNDPRQPRVMLIIKAVIVPEFSLSERTIYFGTVPKGQAATKEIIITVPSDRPVKLVSAESTDSSVSVRMEPVTDSGGKKYKILAAQKSDAKEGYHVGFVVVKTTSNINPELKIAVRGVVGPPSSGS